MYRELNADCSYYHIQFIVLFSYCYS